MASNGTTTATARRHVVVLDYPFTSHTFATHGISRLLAAAAPDVLFSFLGIAKSNATVASVPAPPNLTLYAVTDTLPGETPPTHMFDVANSFLKAAPGNLMEGVERAVKESGGAKVTCVLADSFMAKFAGKMAEEMGVPWIALRTGAASSLSIYVHREVIRQNVGVGDHDAVVRERKLDFIPNLSYLEVRDLPEGLVDGHSDQPMPTLLREMGRELPSAAAVAVNTFQALEGDIISDLNTKLRKTLPVGPLHILMSPTSPALDPHGCLPWLDRQPPSSVAYVSFGTMASPTSVELANLALGLEVSGVPFLWSLNKKFTVHLPEGFLDRIVSRGMVVPWVPQTDVLNHTSTAAFVTHCGWKSVMESITAGVPMICRPICFDQKINAKQVVNMWKVGMSIDEQWMSMESVVDALKSVVGSGGINMRKAVVLLKQLAMEAVGPSGTSTKSFEIMKDIICS